MINPSYNLCPSQSYNPVKLSYQYNEQYTQFCTENSYVPLSQLRQHYRYKSQSIILNNSSFNKCSSDLYLKICLICAQMYIFVSYTLVFHNPTTLLGIL